jgi:hypothetical protein
MYIFAVVFFWVLVDNEQKVRQLFNHKQNRKFSLLWIYTTASSRMTESVGNNEIWQIWNLPSKNHFCNSNSINITKNVFDVVSSTYQLKTSVQCELSDKKTPTFFNCFIANRLSHCWSRCILRYHRSRWIEHCWIRIMLVSCMLIQIYKT